MKRRTVLKGAGTTAAVALLGAGTASACCCGRNCPCENMCPYCAECDDGGTDPIQFE